MIEFINKFLGKEKGYKNLADDEFQSEAKSVSKPVFLDVRSKSEFDSEKIPNALNYDIRNPNFKEKINKLDKNKYYFVYCQSGRRSARACKIMIKFGYQNVTNLKGGIRSYSGRII